MRVREPEKGSRGVGVGAVSPASLHHYHCILHRLSLHLTEHLLLSSLDVDLLPFSKFILGFMRLFVTNVQGVNEGFKHGVLTKGYSTREGLFVR